MAANRFLRATKVLWLANFAVYTAIAVAVVAFGPALRFACAQLPSYLAGEVDFPEHVLWEARAEELLEKNTDLDEARHLLTRVIAAEPNGDAYALLGDVFRAQGRFSEALRSYERSLELDPTRAEVFIRTAELLEAGGDPARAAGVVQEGIASLERLLRLHVPVPDPTVEENDYNEKAREVRDGLARGIAALGAELDRLSHLPR